MDEVTSTPAETPAEAPVTGSEAVEAPQSTQGTPEASDAADSVTEPRTFTQAEVDAIVGKARAQAARAAAKNHDDQTSHISEANDRIAALEAQLLTATTELTDTRVDAAISAAATAAGVAADRMALFTKLVNRDALIVDGAVQAEKAADEVAAVLADAPEFATGGSRQNVGAAPTPAAEESTGASDFAAALAKQLRG